MQVPRVLKQYVLVHLSVCMRDTRWNLYRVVLGAFFKNWVDAGAPAQSINNNRFLPLLQCALSCTFPLSVVTFVSRNCFLVYENLMGQILFFLLSLFDNGFLLLLEIYLVSFSIYCYILRRWYYCVVQEYDLVWRVIMDRIACHQLTFTVFI